MLHFATVEHVTDGKYIVIISLIIEIIIFHTNPNHRFSTCAVERLVGT